MVYQLSTQQFAEKINTGWQPVLLDVREPAELEDLPFQGYPVLPVPMMQVPANLHLLPASTPVVVVCAKGGRSMQVAQFLAAQGVAEVYNLSGGIQAWVNNNGQRE